MEYQRHTAYLSVSLRHWIAALQTAIRRPWVAPAGLALLTCMHGLLYIALVPPWQVPDEPTLFEYTALTAELGRAPAADEYDPALEERIVASMRRQHFFPYVISSEPNPPPQRFDDVRQYFFMPRQVGADPPLAFALAALPLALLRGQPIEQQLLALRLLNLCCTIGATVCAYYAAREVETVSRTENREPRDSENRETRDSSSYSPFITHHSSLALAVGAFVALQPMFVFAGMGAGNDALANLIGAALCLVLLHSLRRGWSLWNWVLVLLLIAGGAWTKRSLAVWVLLLVPLIVWRGLAQSVVGRGGFASPPRRLVASSLLLLAVGVFAYEILGAQFNSDEAAGWTRGGSVEAMARVPKSAVGEPALLMRPGQEALQVLPAVVIDRIRNKGLWFTARVWSDTRARGNLVVEIGDQRQALPFVAGPQPRELRMLAFVPLRARPTTLLVSVDQGNVYACDLWASVAAAPDTNLLLNGNLRWPALRPGSALARLSEYARLPEIAWLWQSGRLREPLPYGWEWPRYTFVSFWGQFGWMTVPLVRDSLWEPLLALICGVSAVGLVVGLLRRCFTPQERRALPALLALLALIGMAVLLNAYTQPGTQALQQGRYLFPAVVPIALLLALGQRALVPPRWQSTWSLAWCAFWLFFAFAGLWTVARFYTT